jgi:outer membrane protein assembly factor BamE (lipoprotein component of BamABCDE complex)
VHSTIKYNSVQSTINENNEKLLRMKIGATQENVIQLMGTPERSEGYAWGSAWLYRTAMTSGIYGTADSDFTPVVFDQDGKVVGWGRNFFTEHSKKYEINIKNQ